MEGSMLTETFPVPPIASECLIRINLVSHTKMFPLSSCELGLVYLP